MEGNTNLADKKIADIQEAVTPQSFNVTAASGITVSGKYWKIGHIVIINGIFSMASTTAATIELCTIPSIYKPTNGVAMAFYGVDNDLDIPVGILVNNQGVMKAYRKNTAATTGIKVMAVYVI